MFENNTKGWHGSYSVIGRISAEKFHIILRKNEILKEKKRRKKVNTFLFPSDSFEKKNKSKPDETQVDIFEDIPKTEKKIIEKSKKENKFIKFHQEKAICKIKSDIYNSHYLHHKEIEKQLKKFKDHQNLYMNSMKYNPKMEFIWKRVLSGPKWNCISGREWTKTVNNNKIKSLEDDDNLGKDVKLKKNIKNTNKKKKKKNNKYKLDNDLLYTNMKGVVMDKQTARGDLPTYYDNRIRNVKPFIVKNIKKSNTHDMTIRIKTSVKKPINIKNNLRISLSTDYNSNPLLRSYSTKFHTSPSIKKNNNNLVKPNLSQDIKGINFSKTISREQLNFIHRDKEGIRPFFMPNYEMVEPRSVSMVFYSKEGKHKSNNQRLKGVDPNVFFDPNKVINKYNNHIETNAPNFNIMVGRSIGDNPLPGYMINKFDRNSLDSITEKGLRMNCYSNSKSIKHFSTFYPKKSFNRLVNNNYLQDEKFADNCLSFLTKECFKDKKLRKSIEYYNKDVNYYLEQNSLKRNFDGVTFTTYKDNIKEKKDKQFYEKCFDDKYNGFN